jgi:hypothetical protein
MARKRMTADERRQAEHEAVGKQWRVFMPKLEAASSMVAAQALVREAPGQGVAGRQFYSNLGFFLQSFEIPSGSNDTERRLYLEFVRRQDAAGELKPGAVAMIEDRFRHAAPGRVSFY